MPDDLSQAIPLDEPFPGTDPEPPAPDEDAEPDGAIEVHPGRRMVDVSVVVAERKRARESTEKRLRDTELAPLKAKADQAEALQQALDAARPYVELVQQHPQWLQQQPVNPEDSISDEEAEQEARELQLYNAESQLDIRTAKRVIAKRRAEAYQIAQQATRDAVAPYAEQTAAQAQREQFLSMVHELGADDILTPEHLARQFAELGPNLTQHPQIARVALERAVGQAYLKRRQSRGAPPPREPLYSEAPGGRQSPPLTLTDTARKLGLSKADLDASNKTFVPGGASPIGEW